MGVNCIEIILCQFLYHIHYQPKGSQDDMCWKLISGMIWKLPYRGHPRGQFGRKSLPKLADFSLSWAEGEVKMYRMYREIQNLDQNFSLKSWNCRKTSPSLKAPGWPLPYHNVFSTYFSYWHSYLVHIIFREITPTLYMKDNTRWQMISWANILF